MSPRKRPQTKKARKAPKPRPLPLVSTEKAFGAFYKLGFREGPNKSGSHQSISRSRKGGGTDTIPLVLNQKEIPIGTLKGMLRTGNVSEADFLRALGRK